MSQSNFIYTAGWEEAGWSLKKQDLKGERKGLAKKLAEKGLGWKPSKPSNRWPTFSDLFEKARFFQILVSLFPEGAVFFHSPLFSSSGNHAVLDEVTKYGFREQFFPEEEQHGHSWASFANTERTGQRSFAICVSDHGDCTVWPRYAQCCLPQNTNVNLISPRGFHLLVTLDRSQSHSFFLMWALGCFCTENQTVEKLILLLMCVRTSERASHFFSHSFVHTSPSLFSEDIWSYVCVYIHWFVKVCVCLKTLLGKSQSTSYIN